MIVTHQITIDLKERGGCAQIEATQDDCYTRCLAVSLYSGEEAWEIPEDTEVVIRYCKSDGVGGVYDTLPDGSTAWSAEGNVLTLVLAPQVLTTPGTAMLSASLIREEAAISLFAVAIHVRRKVEGFYPESSPYYNVAAFLPGPVSAQEGQFLRVAEVDATGRVLAVEAAQVAVDAGQEPGEADIPRIFFGEALPQSKDETVMSFRYVSDTLNFSGWCKTKAQGNTSMTFPKKNQTVKLYVDAECSEKKKLNFKGWGKQSKFCLKANWIDLTHARNVVSARLWGDVVRSREDFSQLPEEYRESPNQGAVDGFPVKVYAAGIYQGRYTLNIPKDAWMAGMDEDLEEHCILCGENYGSGCFRETAVIDGTDWTDEIHDSVPEGILTRWNEVIDFVQNSTDAEFKAQLGDYFYLDSLLDYHLFGLMSCGLDAYGKNQLYMTYDAQKWIAGMYDMDATWGLWWNGGSFVAKDYDRSEFQDFNDGSGNLLYIRLEKCFYEQLQARWEQLRSGVLSVEHIILRFEEFTDIAPEALVKEDYAVTTADGAFTGIPSKTSCTLQQIRNFAAARHDWCDTYVAGLTPMEEISCTGITLAYSSLLLNAGDTETLTATVTPEDCTEEIVWESSNTEYVTVRNGTVTAVAEGSAVVTATCGSYSASMTITVKGTSVVVNCASIKLSAETLSFTSEGSQTLTATITPDGCTEAIVWESSDTAVATVADGVVTAVGNGEAEITASCGSFSASCTVTVSGLSENLMRNVAWYTGEIASDTGEIQESITAARYTDPFDISSCAGGIIKPSSTAGTIKYSRVALYDENLEFLKSVTLSNYGVVPTNAKYARFSVYGSTSATVTLLGGAGNLWTQFELQEGGYAGGSYNASDTNSSHIRITPVPTQDIVSYYAWGVAFLDEADAVLNYTTLTANTFTVLSVPEDTACIALCATDENAVGGAACSALSTVATSQIS